MNDFDRAAAILAEERREHPERKAISAEARDRIREECPQFHALATSPGGRLMVDLMNAGVPSEEIVRFRDIFVDELESNPDMRHLSAETKALIERECPTLVALEYERCLATEQAKHAVRH